MMRSPEQQYALAKTLPLSELQKVVAGESDIVDMWVADAVGRAKAKQIKAQQGAAAQQMANSPKVAQRDLADFQQVLTAQAIPQPRMEQGVAALPADVDVPEYAGGGIVAFDGGGKVVHAFDGLYIGGNRGPQFARPTEEELEARRLRDQLRRFYQGSVFGFQPSFGGNIAAQREEYAANRAKAEAILSNLDRLDTESLRNLVAEAKTTATPAAKTAAPAIPSALATPVKQGEAGDIRKADIAAGGRDSPLMPAQTAPYIPRNMRMSDVGAPAAPANIDLAALFRTADRAAAASSGAAPTALTTKQGVERIHEAMREAGFDPNFYKKRAEELTAEKEQSKGDRREAAWLRTLEGAFEMMGGESPYAFVNFGKGAAKAVKGIQEDLKDIKKIDRERDKAIRDVQAAEQDYRKSAGLAGLKEMQESQNRLDRYNELRANRTNDLARTLYSGEIQKYVAMQPSATERILERGMRDPNYRAAYQDMFGRAKTDPMADVIEHYAKNPLALERLKDSSDAQERALYDAIKARLAAMSIPSASARPTGTVRE